MAIATTPAAQRALDAAGALFYEHGIGATGVDLIAARSGVAKTTMYAHFGSKDGLVAAYLRARSEAARARLRTDLATLGGEPRAQVLAMFDLLADAMDDPAYRGCPFIKAAVELCDTAHPGRAEADAHRTWLRGRVVRLCEDLGAVDAAGLATSLLLLYDAAMVQGAVDDARGRAARSARASAETLIAAAVR